MKLSSNDLRRWCRVLHRDLSFLFSGMVLIYAISGIYMNHRDQINPHYSVSRTAYNIADLPAQGAFDREAVEALMDRIGADERYTKHYFPREGHLKVFLKGGSSIEADLASGRVVYESLRRRPLVSTMTTMHYNPNKWWTWFADAFAVALITITLTGVLMLKGKKGLWGRGGVELLIGIAIPLLLLFLSK